MNYSYCSCKFVIYEKCKASFSQGKFNSYLSYFSTLYPYFNHLLHTIIKRILCIPKIISQNTKNASQFFKRKKFTCGELKASLRFAYFLRSEFQRIIRILNNATNFKLNYLLFCTNFYAFRLICCYKILCNRSLKTCAMLVVLNRQP